MRQIINLTSETELDFQLRIEALKEFLERLTEFQGIENYQPKVNTRNIINQLNSLYQDGRISYQFIDETRVDINYIPSPKSKEAVFNAEPSCNWNNNIIKKHRKSFRKTYGAIFKLPLENSDDYLEAFITDWSPFPAAAAVAVHQDHPITQKIVEKKGTHFTGIFCRHPLTGDLLPVYVAEWVKPEFGTGVVIINPAHSQMDLNFARKIGLPIRFALASQNISSDPKSWVTPPVIKEGKTINTGRFDGLNIEEATNKYYSELKENGFAEMVNDLGVGSYKLGSFDLEETGNWYLDLKTKMILSEGEINFNNKQENKTQNFKSINLNIGNLLNQISSISQTGTISLITTSSEINKSLLFARLLNFDLTKKALLPELFIVQKMTGGNSEIEKDIMKLVALVRGPLNEIAALKKDNLEQAMRFFTFHEELLIDSYDTLERDESLSKLSANIKKSILEKNFQKAFSDLYALQKQLRKKTVEDRAKSKSLIDYYCFAYLLSNLKIPIQIELHRVWTNI